MYESNWAKWFVLEPHPLIEGDKLVSCKIECVSFFFFFQSSGVSVSRSCIRSALWHRRGSQLKWKWTINSLSSKTRTTWTGPNTRTFIFSRDAVMKFQSGFKEAWNGVTVQPQWVSFYNYNFMWIYFNITGFSLSIIITILFLILYL